MKKFYDGCPITNKLCEAMDLFDEKYPDRNFLIEAYEDFFEKEGFYSKGADRERYNSKQKDNICKEEKKNIMKKFKGLSVMTYGETKGEYIIGYYIECKGKSYIITDVSEIYYDDEIGCDVYEVDASTIQQL